MKNKDAPHSNVTASLSRFDERIAFWFKWVLANVFGLLTGRYIGGIIHELLWPPLPLPPNAFPPLQFIDPAPRILVVGLLVGMFIGIFEMLLLRSVVSIPNWKWVASSALACTIFPRIPHLSYTLNELIPDFIIALTSGFFLGIMQWSILRKTFTYAGLWILTKEFTFPLIFWSISPSIYYQSGHIIVGLLVGGITGGVMLYLLQHPITSENILS
ncbi:MAG: hypothetical protein HY867_09815 [Chloroflexi bacterium]|nr:hypothetical protein [Chloroflexota bacterium]